MKRIAFPLLIIAAFLLTACGSSTPTATQPSVAEPASTQPPAAEPDATEAPAQPSATDAPAVTGGGEVIITLADNTITTSQTAFQAGVTYTLVITNNGRRLHNFNINPPISVAGSLDAALAQALLIVTKDKIGPGQTYRVDFTFPASAVGQQLEFSCLIQKHYDDGMTVAITVTQ